MKRYQKILLIWLGINILYGTTIALFPHKEIPFSSFVSYSVQTLLMVLAVAIFTLEPARKNRYIFLNFAVFFLFGSGLAHLINFFGHGATFFNGDYWIRTIIDQYVFRIGYFTVLAFTVVYITVDLLLRDFSTSRKYLVAFAVVGSFTAYYYLPFLQDPIYFKSTDEMLQWKDVDNARKAFVQEFGNEPSEDELVASVPEMFTYRNKMKIGILYPEEKERRIRELYPYVADPTAYVILMFKPFHTNAIMMSVVCLGFILLFFGYQYMKDPPQGAYIEKIMFLLLVFCTLEILHAYSSLQMIQWDAFIDVIEVGGYISVAVLLLLAAFFGLRLRFITSAKGEFYEQELAASPAGITRWRDLLDNVVIEKFFNRKLILGRLAVDPRTRRNSN
jgi:hypothetical protein